MRRRVPFFRTVVALGATLVVAAVGLLVFARVDRVVVAPGRLAGSSVVVRAPWSGQVLRCRVEPGQRVAAGDPLIELQTEHLRAEITRCAARLDALGSRIAALEAEREHATAELHPGQQSQAGRSIERARLMLARAKARTQALEQLRALGLVSRLELEQAELGRDLAEVELAAAVEERPLLSSRQQAEIEQLEAAITSAEAERAEQQVDHAELERQLERAVIQAPVDGVVVGQQLDRLAGSSVTEGELLLGVDTGRVERFDGMLDDRGRAVSRAGLKVRIRLDAYPWLVHGTLEGTVDTVADGPDGERSPAGGRFLVRIAIEPASAPGALCEGMGGQARIIVAERVPLGRLLIEKLARATSP